MKILVLSDIHGNLPALEVVLGHARGFDEVLVLGDLVDYGPWPGEVIDTLRRLGARVIRGNHDHAVGHGVDCRCGEATHWLSVWFRNNITLRLLSEADRKYLASLPLEELIEDLLAVHGCPRNPLYCYLYPWSGKEELASSLARSGLRLEKASGDVRIVKESVVGVGHTHIQFSLKIEGKTIFNPGSVGQPRDGDPRASYAIYDADDNAITLVRVRYPVERVVKKLVSMGVSEPYLEALKEMFLKARVPSRPGGLVARK